ncbi:MAG: hypothetical protein PPHEINF_2744 [uncultured Paraburkholderia sp.]|nr:MAG: hypothetical protein PPHEINF_2744 [uncultured Paraburkholderia sp.]CAH2789876.1 MAG: hypothetical protein PPHEESC_2799 [uncultured Paraburkholderia sp.]CAH2924050.1 MAG: hypothetical protein PPHEMADMSA_2702 [uncultured Paraburkholderia sp.]CAH2925858.1 MAG: hypothetical protein PPHERAN_2848 [uncultured Paraburkholderia sp.]
MAHLLAFLNYHILCWLGGVASKKLTAYHLKVIDLIRVFRSAIALAAVQTTQVAADAHRMIINTR